MYELTKEEIEIQRTPKEHIDWVLSTFNKYDGSHEETVYARNRSTDELKVLFEESYPLLKLCEIYLEKDVILKQVVGNQSHDVIVSNSEEIKFIEITQAINGYSEKLRMIKLNEDGHVSASNPVYTIRRHGVTQIDIGYDIPEGMEAVEVRGLTVLIEEVVRKKVAIGYPDKTVLLIAFDNAIQSSICVDIADLEYFMEETIAPLVKDNFVAIVLVGLSGSYYYKV